MRFEQLYVRLKLLPVMVDPTIRVNSDAVDLGPKLAILVDQVYVACFQFGHGLAKVGHVGFQVDDLGGMDLVQLSPESVYFSSEFSILVSESANLALSPTSENAAGLFLFEVMDLSGQNCILLLQFVGLVVKFAGLEAVLSVGLLSHIRSPADRLRLNKSGGGSGVAVSHNWDKGGHSDGDGMHRGSKDRLGTNSSLHVTGLSETLDWSH